MRHKPAIVLSLRQASKAFRKAERHFLISLPVIAVPKCYGENGEPLYCADAMMKHMACLLDDIARGTFDESNVRQIAASNLGQ